MLVSFFNCVGNCGYKKEFWSHGCVKINTEKYQTACNGLRGRPTIACDTRAGPSTSGGPQWPQSSLYPHLNIKTASLRAVSQRSISTTAHNITQTN